MQVPHIIEKSQQFLQEHEREASYICNCISLILTLALFAMLGAMIYLSVFG